VDEQSKADYGEHLEENLSDLQGRLLRGGYAPKPARRTWVEKPESTEKRPLAISCFEDKLVQLALRDLLEAVFEPSFLPCSYSYREGKSIHPCVDDFGWYIQKREINHVLEPDIRKFFDRMNRDWRVKFVSHRISDKRQASEAPSGTPAA
jgi:RNA-directed DNA polymerase